MKERASKSPSNTPEDRFAGFVSYHKATDSSFCRDLQQDLERFGKPLLRPRMMRLFRDEANLAATADLSDSLCRAIDSSAYLILLARPESAQSKWVGKEIERFISKAESDALPADSHAQGASKTRLDRLICVITAGYHPFETAPDRKDPTCALSERVIECFREAQSEPLIVDMRPYVALRAKARRNHPDYISNVATIAARVLGREKDSLFGDHISRQRRIRTAILTAAMGFVGVLVMAGWFWLQSKASQLEAERRGREARINEARELHSRADGAAERADFDQALVYLAHAGQREPTEAPLDTLTEALGRAHKESWRTPVPFAGFQGIYALANGGRVLAGAGLGSILLWDLATGRELRTLPCPLRLISAVGISEDARWVFAGDSEGTLWRCDVTTGQGSEFGRRPWRAADRDQWRNIEKLLPGPDGGLIAAGYSPGGEVVRFNPDGRPLWTNAPGGAVGFQIVRDLKRDAVIAVTVNGNYRVWQGQTGASIASVDRTLEVSLDFDHLLTVDPGSTLAARIESERLENRQWRVAVWRIDTGQPEQTLTLDSWPTAMAFADGGKTLLVAWMFGGIQSFDLGSGAAREAVPLPASKGFIDSLVVLPEGGKLLATIDNSGSLPTRWDFAKRRNQHAVRVFELATGARLDRLHGHDGPIRAVVFGPDGRWLASAGDDGLVRIWDTSSGSQTRVLTGAPEGIASLAVHPDGARLLGGTETGRVLLWQVRDGREPSQILAHTGSVARIAVSPEGTQIATVGGPFLAPDAQRGADQAIRLWDADSGTLQGELPQGHRTVPHTLHFLNEGQQLLTASTTELIVWDLTTRTLRTQFDALTGLAGTGKGQSSALSSVWPTADGAFYAGLENGQIELRNFSHHAVLKSLAGHREPVTALAGAADTVVSGTGAAQGKAGSDEALRVWNTFDQTQRFSIPGLPRGISSLALSTDGRQAAVGGNDFSLRLFNLTHGLESSRQRVTENETSLVAFSPSGMAVELKQAAFRVKMTLRNLSTGQQTVCWDRTDTTAPPAVFSPDGSRLLIDSGSHLGQQGILWDTAAGEQRTLLVGAALYSRSGENPEFSPDGKTVILYRSEGPAAFSSETGLKLWQLRLESYKDEPETALAVHANRERVLVRGPGQTAEIRNVRSGDRLQRLELPEGAVPLAARFSPEGSLLVASGSDGYLHSWNVPGRLAGNRFSEPGGAIDYLRFSPDNQWLATASSDGTVQLWDPSKRTRVARLSTGTGHATDRLIGLEFTPDARVLCGVHSGGTVIRWPVDRLGELYSQLADLTAPQRVEFAEALVGRSWTSNTWTVAPLPPPSAVTWLTPNSAPPAALSHSLPNWLSVRNGVRPMPSEPVRQALAHHAAAAAKWIEARASAWAAASGKRPTPTAPNPSMAVLGGHQQLAALQAANDWYRVLPAAAKLIGDSPDDLEAWMALARANLELNLPNALFASERAFELLAEKNDPLIDPRLSSGIPDLRARVLLRYNQFAEALPLLARLCGDGINADAELWEGFLRAVLELGRYEQALQLATDAPAKGGSSRLQESLNSQRATAQFLIDARRRASQLPAYCLTDFGGTNTLGGLAAGDLVSAINGVPADEPNSQWWAALSFQASLPAFTHHSLELVRGEKRIEVPIGRSFRRIATWTLTAEGQPVVAIGAWENPPETHRELLPFDVLTQVASRQPSSVWGLKSLLRRLPQDEPLPVTFRRYAWSERFGLQLERDPRGQPMLDPQGQPRWISGDFTNSLTPKQALNMPWVTFFLAPPWRGKAYSPQTETATPGGQAESSAEAGSETNRLPANTPGAAPRLKLPFRRRGTEVSFNRTATDQDLASLQYAADATSVSLKWTHGISSKGLTHLLLLRGLRELDLEWSDIDDRGIAVVGTLTNLATLDLARTRVSDAGLLQLAGLRNLTNLSLAGTNFAGAGLCALADMPSLRRLEVESASLGSDGLACLGRCLSLKHLSLGGLRAKAVNLGALASLTNLIVLDLSGVPVENRDLDPITALPRLQKLDLSRTSITGKAFDRWPSPSPLKVLDVGATSFDDDGLAALTNQPSIRELDLFGTEVTDAGLVHLRALPLLEVLDLRRTRVSAAGLGILKELRQLLELRLSGEAIGDEALRAISPGSSIHTLSLTETKVTDSGLSFLAGWRQLTNLDLSECPILGPGLTNLLQLPLRSLDVSSTAIGDPSADVLSQLKTLNRLRAGRTQLTEAGTERIEAALPDLDFDH